MSTASDVVMGVANSGVTKGASKLMASSLKMGIEGGAKVLNSGIKTVQKAGPNAKKAIGKINKEDIGRSTGKFVRNTLSDEQSYNNVLLRDVGKKNKTTIMASNKFLLADDLGNRARTGINSAITMSKPLVTTGADNLMPFGMKATGLGVAAAAAFNMASGVPQAADNFNKNRMGTNYDNQATRITPQAPAYSNNGGATGDLVFALNNLRHGGMM
ncbi:MAG: hypothetical protein ACRC4Q_08145 [Paraclostridium dentum]